MRIVKSNYKKFQHLAWIRKDVVTYPIKKMGEFIAAFEKDGLVVAYEIPSLDEIVGNDKNVVLVTFGYHRKDDLYVRKGPYNQKEFTENRPSGSVKFGELFQNNFYKRNF